MIDSRDLNELAPAARKRAEAFFAASAADPQLRAQGITVIATSTYRDFEAQSAIYARGRTAPGKVVTNARAGDSWHNWRCAFDEAQSAIYARGRTAPGKVVTNARAGDSWHNWRCAFDEAQSAIYARGRTAPGKVVTNARAGDSWHNWRCAFDVLPLRCGKPMWGTTGADRAVWQRIGENGEACGLEWAGRWTTFREMAHFQYTCGLTLADFKAGKTMMA